jgi:nuclear pore complex protein Nup205
MYDIKDDDIYASVNTLAPSSLERQLPLLELLKVWPCTDF